MPVLQKYYKESLGMCAKVVQRCLWLHFFMAVRRETNYTSICGDLISSHDTYVRWNIIYLFKMT